MQYLKSGIFWGGGVVGWFDGWLMMKVAPSGDFQSFGDSKLPSD